METEQKQYQVLNTVGDMKWYQEKADNNKIYALIKLYTITSGRGKRHDRKIAITNKLIVLYRKILGLKETVDTKRSVRNCIGVIYSKTSTEVLL